MPDRAGLSLEPDGFSRGLYKAPLVLPYAVAQKRRIDGFGKCLPVVRMDMFCEPCKEIVHGFRGTEDLLYAAAIIGDVPAAVFSGMELVDYPGDRGRDLFELLPVFRNFFLGLFSCRDIDPDTGKIFFAGDLERDRGEIVPGPAPVREGQLRFQVGKPVCNRFLHPLAEECGVLFIAGKPFHQVHAGEFFAGVTGRGLVVFVPADKAQVFIVEVEQARDAVDYRIGKEPFLPELRLGTFLFYDLPEALDEQEEFLCVPFCIIGLFVCDTSDKDRVPVFDKGNAHVPGDSRVAFGQAFFCRVRGSVIVCYHGPVLPDRFAPEPGLYCPVDPGPVRHGAGFLGLL